MHRVLRELGVSDVPLHAVYREPAAVGAAAADLDGVADLLLAGGLAHDAPVDALVPGDEGLHHLLGAIHRGAFLIARDEIGDRAFVLRVLANEGLGGGDHGGEAALHVGRTAPVQDAVAHHRLERVGFPFLERPGWDHVGVTREAEQGCRGAPSCPDVVDDAVAEALDLESGRGEPGRHNILTAFIRWRHGATGDEVLGERERVGHQPCGENRFTKKLRVYTVRSGSRQVLSHMRNTRAICRIKKLCCTGVTAT